MNSSTSPSPNSRKPVSNDSPGFAPVRWAEEFISDLQFGFRQVFKNKLHTTIIVMTLALCLGSNTTAYNFMKKLVTNPFEYGNTEGIAQVGKEWPKVREGVSQVSITHFHFLKENSTSFEELGFVDDEILFDLDLGSRVRRVRTDLITPEIWRITQVKPIVGRFFTEEDVENNSGRVVVLGEALWNDLRSEESDMIGQEVTLDGQNYRVIGVAPQSFYLSYQHSEAWLPRIFTPNELSETWRRNDHSYMCLARLKEGVTMEQADKNLKGVYEAFLDIYPEDRDDQERTGATFSAANVNDMVIQNLPQIAVAFRSVQIVTFIVLLIGCLNVSGMIMVRSFSRIQEFAMRRALGGSIRRLSSQILTEIIIYFMLGGLFSLFVLQLGFLSAQILQLDQIPWASEFELDASSLQITFLIAFCSALITGAVPVISVMRRDLIGYVKSGGRSVSGSAAKHRMHAFFVISQVTLSVVLLVLAGVLILNLNAVLKKNTGFVREGRIAFQVQMPDYRFGEGWENYKANKLPFIERTIEKLNEMPMVIQASAANRIPISPYNMGHSDFSMDHYEYAPGEQHASGLRMVTMPGYFDTVGTKLLMGRDFAKTDTSESEKVIIISQNMMEKYYEGINPIGQTINFWGNTCKIIGVAEQVQDKPYFMSWDGYTLYFSYQQWDMENNYVYFTTHVQGDPLRSAQTLKQAILDVDPKVTIETHTFDEMFEIATFAQQLPMMMTMFFACIALMLSGIGLYGLISFTVIERTKEYGIRMALGANPLTILKRILKGSGKLVGWGMVVGLLVSIALAVQINPMLTDVNTVQPLVFLSVIVFVAIVCTIASLLPAIRATRINVIDTLRYE